MSILGSNLYLLKLTLNYFKYRRSEAALWCRFIKFKDIFFHKFLPRGRSLPLDSRLLLMEPKTGFEPVKPKYKT